jgi:hypothetical protein
VPAIVRVCYRGPPYLYSRSTTPPSQ